MKLLDIGWQSKLSLIPRAGCILGTALLLAVSATQVKAFSLLGPYDSWQLQTLGYRLPSDIGGPVNLGAEYRWNVPVLTYTFDQSFWDYFGTDGVAAVESAISILNNLPPASQLDPTNYPPEVTRFNFLAQAQGLIDLKSQTLVLLLEQLGLTSPTRFTFCMRNLVVSSDGVQGVAIQRNFDPISLAPTNWVNDTAYWYNFYYFTNGQEISADAVEYPIDPFSSTYTAVADGNLFPGALYTGLTRDDVGGLRYLLHTNNNNFEPLLSDVHGAGTNAVTYINQAPRPGIDKITFVRRDYDSLFSKYFSPFTNQFIDTYWFNNTLMQQQVERVITRPDFVFSAADLSDGSSPTPRLVRTSTTNWLSSPAAPGQVGPGIIQPQVQITFNSATPSPSLRTTDTASSGDLSVQDWQDYRWGSFDNSTNPPVIYPIGTQLVDTNQLTIRLWLHPADSVSSKTFTWQLPVSLGGQATLFTSTNLVNWARVAVVNNYGSSVDWDHSCSHPRRFFKVVPQ